jgi:hypothetical protein
MTSAYRRVAANASATPRSDEIAGRLVDPGPAAAPSIRVTTEPTARCGAHASSLACVRRATIASGGTSSPVERRGASPPISLSHDA